MPYKQRVGGSNPSTPTKIKYYKSDDETKLLLVLSFDLFC